jgi:mannitol-1-/sugar-/sorbitol-6-phosphatase
MGMALSVKSSSVTLQCQGVLFDMDGILISSIGSVERSWTKWAQMRGIDPAYAISKAHGCRSIETVAILRPDLDPVTENDIIEGLECDDVEGISVLPGALELLAALPPNRWTVVTSATEPLARVRLAAGRIPIPARIVTAESVSEGKPHPAPYLAGAALLGIPPEQCIVFEDAASGTKAGRAAGCTVIATPFSHSIESLEAANYIIADLTEVKVTVLPGDEGIRLEINPIGRELR